jgi:hypothetical protein
MPEAQTRRLLEMMRHIPSSTTLEACLPPMHINKSVLNKLEKGDLLLLPIEKMELMLFDERRQEIVAKALYGLYDETPSVLIVSDKKDTPKTINTNKYNKLKIVVGTVEQKIVERDKILPLQYSQPQNVTLYRGNRLIAYAKLQQHRNQIVLRIEEVK